MPCGQIFFSWGASPTVEARNYFNYGTDGGATGPSTNVDEKFDIELDELLQGD